MSYDKANLTDLLQTIYKNTIKGIENPENHRCVTHMSGGGTKITIGEGDKRLEMVVPEDVGPSLSIVDDGRDALDKFVKETLKDDKFREYIGAKAIEKKVKDLLRSTEGVAPEGDLMEVLKSRVLKPLRNEIRTWITFVPIVNLVVDMSLTLGDVTFVSQKVAKQEAHDFIKDHEFAGDAKQQTEQRQHILERATKITGDYTSFAKVTVRAHKDWVDKAAIDRALAAINILRAYTHILYSHNVRALIGIPTEMIEKGSWGTIFLDQEKHLIKTISQLKGPLCPFELCIKNVDYLTQKCHLGAVQEILRKPFDTRTPFENIIIQAFQALGRSVVAPTIGMRFLNCMIALERMLICDNNSTAERLSDRLAFTLSDDKLMRIKIRDKTKKLYDERSRMVHAAYSGVSEEDSFLVEKWAIFTILNVLGKHKEFDSHEQFCGEINNMKF